MSSANKIALKLVSRSRLLMHKRNNNGIELDSKVEIFCVWMLNILQYCVPLVR